MRSGFKVELSSDRDRLSRSTDPPCAHPSMSCMIEVGIEKVTYLVLSGAGCRQLSAFHRLRLPGSSDAAVSLVIIQQYRQLMSPPRSSYRETEGRSASHDWS